MHHLSLRVYWALIIVILSVTSCKLKHHKQYSEEVRHYSLGLRIDGTDCVVVADSLFSEKINVRKRKEYNLKNMIVSENYLYFFNQSEKKIFQYRISKDGTLAETAGLSVAGHVTERALSQNLLDKNTILVMDPVKWGEPEVKWFTIDIPDFRISASGTYQLPYMQQNQDMAWKSNIGRGVLHAGKFIMGTVYYDSKGNFAKGAHVVTFDYPGMTNPQLVSTDQISAELGNISTSGYIKTTSGDLYITTCREDVMGTTSNNKVNGYILKMRKDLAAFDETYHFDLSAALNEPVGIAQLDYLGGNEAMATLADGQKAENSDGLGNDRSFFVKIDMESKKVLRYTMPLFDGRIAKMPLILNGKYTTFFTSDADKTTHILEIDTHGGSDAFTKGALIDGENVRGYGIIKHPFE
jgi:hypothetical protein